MKRKKKIIIIGEQGRYSDMFSTMCSDVGQDSEVIFFNEPYDSYNWPVVIIRKIMYRLGLNYLCEKNYKLSKILAKKENRNTDISILFFNPGLVWYYSEKYLEFIRRKYGVRIGIIFTDIMGVGVSKRAEYLLKKTDLIDYAYSIEGKDVSKKYNVKRCYTPYAPKNIQKEVIQQYDVYFAGVVKDRGMLLKECMEKLIKREVDTFFEIVGDESEVKIFKEFGEEKVCTYSYDRVKKYSDILMASLKSRVLLDINANNQEGLTLRPYEAVVYNKRLLTNNKNILKFKYYNPKYMRYFETITNDDIEWIKEEVSVDYNYKGEFSILNIVHDIKESLQTN